MSKNVLSIKAIKEKVMANKTYIGQHLCQNLIKVRFTTNVSNRTLRLMAFQAYLPERLFCRSPGPSAKLS